MTRGIAGSQVTLCEEWRLMTGTPHQRDPDPVITHVTTIRHGEPRPCLASVAQTSCPDNYSASGYTQPGYC